MEPVSPMGRTFLQPSMNMEIYAAIGTRNPIDVAALKEDFKMILSHPQFSSILVKDTKGREQWRRVEHVDVEKHVFTVPDEDPSPDFVNDYLTSLMVSPPLDLAKPLWEVHVLRSHQCIVIRVHHAVGDGILLMSLFISCCRGDSAAPILPTPSMDDKETGSVRGRLGGDGGVWRAMLVAWYSLVYSVDSILRSCWVKDKEMPIRGREGAGLWPRKLKVVMFELSDMKMVKNVVGGTINDVLLGVISLGLRKFMDHRSFEIRDFLRITGMVIVNTRRQPGLQDPSKMMQIRSARWGNDLGHILIPIYLHKEVDDPLDYVRMAKTLIERKKLSFEAHFSSALTSLTMSLFGPKVPTLISHRIASSTSLLISNVVGPSEEILASGNPITYIRTTISGAPQAITMHLVSYMGRAELLILVAKDVIPDSDVLKKCFEEAFEDIKKSAHQISNKE